jgi:hypothetical protein
MEEQVQVVLVKREIELPKETSEIVDAVGEMFEVVEKTVADGFQAGQDLPVIAVAAMQTVMVAMDGAKAVPAEVKADPAKLAVLSGLLAEKIVKVFVKK